MPTYDRVHLSSCLANAVRCAVENLRDDAAVSHLMFHNVINGGDYHGETLYSIAYGYLEDGYVGCTCGAVPTRDLPSPSRTLAYIDGRCMDGCDGSCQTTDDAMLDEDSQMAHYERFGRPAFPNEY